jgi:hypothetical protein
LAGGNKIMIVTSISTDPSTSSTTLGFTCSELQACENGSCSSKKCECNIGFTGGSCAMRKNPCAVNPCNGGNGRCVEDFENAVKNGGQDYK